MKYDLDYSHLTLRHLMCFINLVEFGNMHRCAELMHMSQPLFSQKISQLEQTLGVDLFIRNSKRLVLTAGGEAFYRDCRRFCAGLDSSVDELRHHYGRTTDTVRVGFSDGQESSSSSIIMSSLQGAFPDKKMEIIYADRLRLPELLDDHSCDFIILVETEGVAENKRYNHLNIKGLSLNCMCTRQSAIAKKEPFSWEDLDAYICDWSLPLKDSNLIKTIDLFCKEKGIQLSHEFHHTNYFAARKYLPLENHCMLTFSPQVDDASFCIKRLSGITFPCMVIWNKDDQHVQKYIDIIQNILKAQAFLMDL